MTISRARQISTTLFVIAFLVVGGWFVFRRTTDTNTVEIPGLIRNCPMQTLEQEIAAADVIVAATVTMVVPGSKYAEVYLNPQTTYKGQLIRPMRLLAQPLTGLAVSAGRIFSQVRRNGRVESELSFATGQPTYLLFLRSSADGYRTSRCDGSRFLGDGLTADEFHLLMPTGVVQ